MVSRIRPRASNRFTLACLAARELGPCFNGIYWELPMLVPLDEQWVLFATSVIHDVPARTLYWKGDFDGRRFRADNPEPHTWDVAATYRAPTIAAGPDGTPINIGIIADELRDEPARHRAGRVPTLGLAQQTMLCPSDGTRLCAAIAPAILNLFQDLVAPEPSPQDAFLTFDLGSRPSLLRATVAGGEAGMVRIGLRTSAQGVAAAELRIDLRSGEVVLDYSKGTLLPLSRPARIIGQMPSGDTVEIALVIDGSAISATLNGQSFGAMVFAAGPGQDCLTLALDRESEWKALEVHTRR